MASSRPSHGINILEFARRAGLSTATVSRAFHEPEKVKAATREHVLKLAEELHYFPNPSGRALVTGRHDVIGLIWPMEVEGPEAQFSHRILAALAQVLAADDLDLLICPVDRRKPGTVEHARRTLMRSRCDAWILLYPRHHDALVEVLKNGGKPVVCLMGELEECPEWKCVRLNQQRWIEDAMKRFGRAGCRGVALFGTRTGEPDHEERKSAFAKLASKYFGSRFTVLPDWPPDVDKLKACLLEGKADAILGVDDHAALLALDVCRDLAIEVPRQVKVVGIDDTWYAPFSAPALSSYRQPLDEMVRCAVDLAMGKRSRSARFEAVFVPRRSLPD